MWMIFGIIDIIRHQNRVPNPTELIGTNSKQTTINRQSSITSELIEAIQEEQSDESDNGQLENNDGETFEISDHHRKSTSSSENLSRRLSANVTREVSFR